MSRKAAALESKARKPRSPVVDEAAINNTPEGVPTDEPEADPFQQSERESIDALFAELAGVASARVTVYRTERNKPQEYMFKCSAAEFSLDDLREVHGGGTFRLYVSRDGKTIKNLQVSVARKDVSAPMAGRGEDLATLVREGFEAQANVMREMIAAMRPPQQESRPFFNSADLPAIITAATGAIAGLRALVVPPAASTSGMDAEKVFDLVSKAVTLSRDIGAGGGGEGGGGGDSLMSLLKELIKSPMMSAAVTALQSTQPRPVARPAIPAAPPAGVAAIGAPAHPAQTMVAPTPASAPAAPDPAGLRQYLSILCGFAADGSDATLYADLVLDRAPEGVLHALLAQQPTPVDFLITLHPNVANYREWFVLLIDTIREALETPDEGEGNAGPQVNGVPGEGGENPTLSG